MTPHRALSSAFDVIISFEVDQIVVLDETCSRWGSPGLAALLAHLPASGEALPLSATRVPSEAAGRPRGRKTALEAGRAASLIAVTAAASVPDLTA